MNVSSAGTEPTDRTEAVRNAIERLAALDPRKACIARMRIAGRLPLQQIAFFLDLAEATVAQDWCFARAWLAREVGGSRR